MDDLYDFNLTYFFLQIFKDSYKFVDEIKEKELKTLKKELKEEEDPERKEQIKYLIQRQVLAHSVEITRIPPHAFLPEIS